MRVERTSHATDTHSGRTSSKAGARDRADDLAREVAALAITLHTSLIKSAVRDVLDR